MFSAASTLSAAYPRPGLMAGPFPEAFGMDSNRGTELGASLARWRARRSMTLEQFRVRWSRIEARAGALDDRQQILDAARHLQIELRQQADGTTKEALVEEGFALATALIRLELGFHLHLEQGYGGWLIHEGMIAEMQTGEGKTVTAALPACTAALGGSPVHVITVNDYLVGRDATLLHGVYAGLGLSVGAITESSTEGERRQAYAADVTYVSNKQLVFDYLKDRQNVPGAPNTLRARLSGMISPQRRTRLQRGLCFAIVDEADSVLIDEAKTPLILSKPGRKGTGEADFTVALGVARRLENGAHFAVQEQAVSLTEEGDAHLAQLTASLPNRWRNQRYRRELIVQGLTALHVLQRDTDYLVRDDTIVLVDEHTGRVMPDRSLSHGLHQMVQVKEGCPVSAPTETLARISFQNFFARYLHLGGMTGTATEVKGELLQVYGLGVRQVPTHRPCARKNNGVSLYATTREKYEALIEEVRRQQAAARPVLIGTRSVIESEQVQRLLQGVGLSPVVLNATQDANEAGIIANAGEPGQIVVATNMAGRGTDIALQGEAAASGGLHVIATQLNDSPRLDRQLQGRSARQGDPGSHHAILSLEDELFRATVPEFLLRRMATAADPAKPAWRAFTHALIWFAQQVRERKLRRVRDAVRRADQQINDLLAFAPQD